MGRDLRSGAGHFDLTSSNAITGQATCFSMALAGALAQDGHPRTKLETDAVCTLDQTNAGYRITTMELTVRGEVEGIGEDEFQSAAKQAEKGRPVSNALAGVEISMNASLA